MKLHAAWTVLLAAAAAHAQPVSMAFSYRIPTTSQVVPVSANGTVAFAATETNVAASASFYAENRESGTVVVDELSASGAGFTVDQRPATSVDPNQLFTATLRFQSDVSGISTGTFSFRATTANRTTRYTFFLSATVLQPRFVISYLLPGGNQLPVRNGERIAYPATLVTQTATATLIIANTGTGRGLVDAVQVSGAAFSVSGLPLLPAQLAADREIRCTLQFSPDARGSHAGQLTLQLSGETVRIALEGLARGAVFDFEFVVDGAPLKLENSVLSLPDTMWNATLSVLVRGRNTGDADGSIRLVALTGSAYRLVDLPQLPIALAPGGSTIFQIVFTASSTGQLRGQLQVDSSVWQLVATVRGARLSLRATVSGVETVIADRGTLNFPNTAVGRKVSANLILRNDGNAPGSVTSISAAGAGFSMTPPQVLPAAIPEGGSLEFAVTFAPDNTGTVTGTLQVDDASYFLRGAGIAPDPLPAVSFVGVNEQAQPFAQPSLGVTLATPYPSEISGQLTLAFTPDSVGDDPAIVFSNGARTVDFRIPAATAEAQFSTGGTRIAFQAGTVAGAIKFSVTLRVGSVNMTTATPPAQTMRIAADAPQLRSVVVNIKSATSLEVLVTGYSTTRAVRRFNLSLASTPGSTVQTASLSADVESLFQSWYQSATSRTYGSQFTAIVTLAVDGKMDAIQSVAVTAANDLGSSASVSANLR